MIFLNAEALAVLRIWVKFKQTKQQIKSLSGKYLDGDLQSDLIICLKHKCVFKILLPFLFF